MLLELTPGYSDLLRYINPRPRHEMQWRTLPIALLLLCVTLLSCKLNVSQADEKSPQNTTSFYDPVVKKIEGWTIKLDPKLLEPENKQVSDLALEALANHLQRVKYIVAEEKLKTLRTLPIWVELNNPKLGNMQYHPGKDWLVKNGHDPRLVKHVHIPRAKSLFAKNMWAKHPYVVLHELAHSYHDQILSFDHAAIKAAYDEAKEKKIYEQVLLFTGKKVRHYGLTNHKEYFAESTEAYFGVNDFYPFVRAELKEHDPVMFLLLKEIWGEVK